MGVFIQSVRFLHLPYPALDLALQIALGVVSYLGPCSIFHLPALPKVIEIIRQHREKNIELKPLEDKAVL
jgi:hypothetical protein